VDVRKRHQKDAVLFWMPEDKARANLAKFGLDLPKETTSFVANHTQVASSKTLKVFNFLQQQELLQQ